MNIYLSKSSLLVKVMTTGTLILLALAVFGLFTTDKNYGLIGGISISIVILATAIYFYAISLDRIILEQDGIVLKKNIGQIRIPNTDILEVQRLRYADIPMTYGSKGVFGFIGNTMGDDVTLVKDRKNMLRITTKNKKYILSSERADELVKEIKAGIICNS